MNEWKGGEPTLDDVRREYPHWSCWRDTSGLYFACRTGNGVAVRGEDPVDLRDMIRRAEALSQQ